MFKTAAIQGDSKLRDLNFYKAILILAILVGVVGFSFAAHTEQVTIYSTGQIIPEIVAKSGYWRDIQDAVNIAASSGIGIVRIPEGTWNFVNLGESWTGSRVIIPAGVSIFGAPTERYENGSVKEWKTVLVLPWDFGVPGNQVVPNWFRIYGSGDPSKPSRFSDIKLVGYREFNSSSTLLHRGLLIENVANFRIDHVCLRHVPEGIQIVGSCGVIDHCILDNIYGWHGGTSWASRTVGYGVQVSRNWPETRWPNITDVLGKYLNYTVFVENCIFTKWRHCIVGNDGAHFVFRHNKVIGGFAYNEVDQHPRYPGQEPYVPCRAGEVYENEFLNPVSSGICIYLFAGGGVYFNNTLVGYGEFMHTADTSWGEMVNPHDIYIWSNNLGGAKLHSGSAVLNEDYFLYKPDWYTPYAYPHPLAYP